MMGHRGHPDGVDSVEHYSERAHPEHVVLDIGGGLGALIVHAEPELHGVEVEISPTGSDASRAHKEVLERQIDRRPAYTAVFDRLAEGRYTLWVQNVARARDVQITGGEIAEIDWTVAPAKHKTAGPALARPAFEIGDRHAAEHRTA
jgi:hypothetical protein